MDAQHNLTASQPVEAEPMPAVIPGVWIGLVTATLGLAASFGVDVTAAQQTAIIGFFAALGAVIPIVDAWLRRARLTYLAARHAATLQLARLEYDDRRRSA